MKGTSSCSPIVNTAKNKQISKVGGSKNKTKKNTIKPVVETSCLTPEILKTLVQAWNKSNSDNQEEQINTKQPYDTMYTQLRSKFNNEEEIFWFDNTAIKSMLDHKKIDEVKTKYFKPLAPETWQENPEQWLSNLDIEAVLNQYEDKYPEFKSYGAMPIDFDKRKGSTCLINSICNISLKKLHSQGKKYIGVVFNLDKSGQPGTHWIALFVNIPAAEINFWDSIANEPPTEVVKLMNKLYSQLKELMNEPSNSTLFINTNKPKKQINQYRHQFKNNECGMYSIHFIIEQLDNGKTFNQVCRNIINDAKMNALRKEYFILSSSNKPKGLFGINLFS